MTIELIKEYDKVGQITYHIKVDNEFQSGTIRRTLPEAMDVYECVKEKYSSARVEVLIKEEI
jgi:hypothetical protein